MAADLEDPVAVARLADDVGAVDILINNAGSSVWGATPDVSVADFDGMFAANVRAPHLLVGALAQPWRPAARAASSTSAAWPGPLGSPGRPLGATKAALAALTRSWAAEYSASGVRVNAVAPRTDLHAARGPGPV